MLAARLRHGHSFREYVKMEEQANLKHEYYDGGVYAMPGGTPEHGAVAMTVGAMLREALHGRPCRIFSSDARVRVAATGLATYPDVSVLWRPGSNRSWVRHVRHAGDPIELELHGVGLAVDQIFENPLAGG